MDTIMANDVTKIVHKCVRLCSFAHRHTKHTQRHEHATSSTTRYLTHKRFNVPINLPYSRPQQVFDFKLHTQKSVFVQLIIRHTYSILTNSSFPSSIRQIKSYYILIASKINIFGSLISNTILFLNEWHHFYVKLDKKEEAKIHLFIREIHLFEIGVLE